MLRAVPLHADAVYLLGVLALDAVDIPAAVLRFHHSTLLQPNSAAYHNALGDDIVTCTVNVTGPLP